MDSALYYMKSALEISPNHPQGLFNAGVVNISTGDSLSAINYWERLVNINGDSPQAKRAKILVETIKNKLNKS
jgi:predicted TPR repeat methyltransferase